MCEHTLENNFRFLNVNSNTNVPLPPPLNEIKKKRKKLSIIMLNGRAFCASIAHYMTFPAKEIEQRDMWTWGWRENVSQILAPLKVKTVTSSWNGFFFLFPPNRGTQHFNNILIIGTVLLKKDRLAFLDVEKRFIKNGLCELNVFHHLCQRVIIKWWVNHSLWICLCFLFRFVYIWVVRQIRFYWFR